MFALTGALYIEKLFLAEFFSFLLWQIQGICIGKRSEGDRGGNSCGFTSDATITVGRGGMVKKNLLIKESARICRTVNISSINLKTDGKIKSN